MMHQDNPMHVAIAWRDVGGTRMMQLDAESMHKPTDDNEAHAHTLVYAFPGLDFSDVPLPSEAHFDALHSDVLALQATPKYEDVLALIAQLSKAVP